VAQFGYMGPCEESDPGGCPEASCVGWNPSAATEHSTKKWKTNIDDDFFAALFDDPVPLIECDTGRFVQHDSEEGGPAEWWDFANLVSGDFFYEIGLRSRDKFVSIVIGEVFWPLDTSEHMMAAFDALQDSGATTFNIYFKRGTAWKEIQVALIDCGSNCPAP
jgi:hypothetical protein